MVKSFKSYLLIFTSSKILMDDSLCFLVDNLHCNLYNRKWKHSIKYRDYKHCEKCKADAIVLNGVKKKGMLKNIILL